MLRRLRMIALVLGVIVALGLVVAAPAFAAGPPSKDGCGQPASDDNGDTNPGYYGYGRILPCTDCDLPFAEGVYRLVDINAAARALGMEMDDVSNMLWAGGSLADMITETQVDARFVRDAVDAERYRALSNSDYLRDDRPDLCCEGDCCPSACVDPECSCVVVCDEDTGKCETKCGGKDWDGHWQGASYRVTAKAGLRLRTGPGTSYRIVTVAPYGTILKSTGNVSWPGGWSWMEVNHGGQRLWCSSAYLTPVY
ncbi:MAG: SH3 domain-containing protein [Anaerolineae bacterium]|nr:SH3 domain-containing protein [Anaerolineae bacterium]